MSCIFCLETEWDQSIHDMKKDSSVHPLLQYLNSLGIEFVFRQVATLNEFKYYIEHLLWATYQRFDTIYLCFHGSSEKIWFANKESISLQEIAQEYPSIFKGRNVHIGACCTLKVRKNVINDFKLSTEANLVTGYAKSVKFHDSFLFELWLMHLFANQKNLDSSKLQKKVEKQMQYYCDKLRFKIY